MSKKIEQIIAKLESCITALKTLDVTSPVANKIAKAITDVTQPASPTQEKPKAEPKQFRVYLNKLPNEVKLVTLKSVTNTLHNMYSDNKVVNDALATLQRDGKFVGSYKTFEFVANA